MNWLVWKEYRHNRLIVIVAAFLLVVPHLVALTIAAWDRFPLRVPPDLSRWGLCLLGSAWYSLVLAQLIPGLLGGNAIAGERVDRSAEFLAYLPVTRARMVVAKLALAAVTALLIWVPNLLILYFAVGALPLGTIPHLGEVFGIFASIATTGFTFFCVAWLWSSLLESPIFAICAGLITPWLIVSGMAGLAWAFELPPPAILGRWYLPVCLTLAPICFVAGTWHYVRRVEP